MKPVTGLVMIGVSEDSRSLGASVLPLRASKLRWHFGRNDKIFFGHDKWWGVEEFNTAR